MMHPAARTTVVLGAAFLGMSCAPLRAAPVQTTSAELAIEYEQGAAESAVHGSYSSALALADRAVALAPENGWGHYDRGVALHHLRRTEDAVAAYREAAGRFGDAAVWAKSIAIYGRARALDDAGRCAEAKVAYAEFATFIQTSDPNAAAMARSYAGQCTPGKATSVDLTSSPVGEAVVAHDYERAIALAEKLPASPEPRPWLDYNRAVALAELGKTDEAVQAFKAAERQFGETGSRDPNSPWGRSVAIYGRARALDNAGRCAEAKKAYDDYVASVRDPQDKVAAISIARRCGTPP